MAISATKNAVREGASGGDSRNKKFSNRPIMAGPWKLTNCEINASREGGGGTRGAKAQTYSGGESKDRG